MINLILSDVLTSCSEIATHKNKNVFPNVYENRVHDCLNASSSDETLVWVWHTATYGDGCRGHLHDDGSEGVSVAKVAEQGQGKSDCSHPDRKSKKSTLRGERGKRCNFTSQITSGIEEKISQ